MKWISTAKNGKLEPKEKALDGPAASVEAVPAQHQGEVEAASAEDNGEALAGAGEEVHEAVLEAESVPSSEPLTMESAAASETETKNEVGLAINYLWNRLDQKMRTFQYILNNSLLKL
jgi:hypothetical protein